MVEPSDVVVVKLAMDPGRTQRCCWPEARPPALCLCLSRLETGLGHVKTEPVPNRNYVDGAGDRILLCFNEQLAINF